VRVSKDGRESSASWFETHCFAMLLAMRRKGRAHVCAKTGTSNAYALRADDLMKSMKARSGAGTRRRPG